MVGELLQEKARLVRNEYIKDRNYDELLGIAKGVLADGIVAQEEVIFMIQWIATHFTDEDINIYPLNTIYDRLKDVMQDGKLTSIEADDIKLLLTMFTGRSTISGQVKSMSSTLPLNTPAPNIEFFGKTFCLTGSFTIGTRTQCEAIIKSLGGESLKNVSNSVDYLVVGIIGSDAWVHSAYGRKIEKAVEIREKKKSIAIISEEHFIKFL